MLKLIVGAEIQIDWTKTYYFHSCTGTTNREEAFQIALR